MLGFDSLGIPLHPLVVHFPIVLSVLLPISAIVALRVVGRSPTPRKVWALPLVLAVALAISAWTAIETGQNEEDRVEEVIGGRAIHGHEEAAERFLVLSGVLVLMAGAGMLPRTTGQAARYLTAAGSIALLGMGVQVGHSGGELVYRHGAAAAYATPAGATDGERTAAAASLSGDATGDAAGEAAAVPAGAARNDDDSR